jgi:hypothetical protein
MRRSILSRRRGFIDMPLPGAIETATAAIGFASEIASFARESRPNKKRVRPIIGALRGIYFTPRGTINILKALADGNAPDPDDVEHVLIDFNDHEWAVHRHLHAMDFDRSDDLGLSLRQRRVLGEIAYGKRNLRRDIQDVLNQPLTENDFVNANDARVLLKRVDALNAMIESLEEEFL